MIEKWKPISSAPKDGHKVLLSDGRSVWIGWWESGHVLFGSGDDGWTDGSPGHWNEQLLGEIGPTHWKPYPKPSPRRKKS